MVTEWLLSDTHLKVGNELGGLLAEAAMVGDISSRLHQQQVVKGLKDVNAGLVDCAHHSTPGVDGVTHTPHDNGCCSGVQSYEQHAIASSASELLDRVAEANLAAWQV